MEKNKNLNAALFCFSFNVMLSFEESISLLEDRIQSGFINKELLREEFERTIENENINWTTYVIEHELITKYQADVFGDDKCKDYVKSLLANYLKSKNHGVEEE